jgi:isoquinoline 1-oxidoreductase beta subunit
MSQDVLARFVGLVLSDELTARQATPDQRNFAHYPIPRTNEMPVFDIDLVPSQEAPSAAGETAIVAGAGVIYNAIVAATGVRPERLPVRAEQLASARPASS